MLIEHFPQGGLRDFFYFSCLLRICLSGLIVIAVTVYEVYFIQNMCNAGILYGYPAKFPSLCSI